MTGNDAGQLIVLTAGNEDADFQMLEQMLKERGAALSKAMTADEAIRKSRDNNLTAIFLDMHLPDMNGLEAARIIKQNRNGHSIPIFIVTSAHSDIAAKPDETEDDMTEMIPRPLTREAMSGRIKLIAELYRSQAVASNLREEMKARELMLASEIAYRDDTEKKLRRVSEKLERTDRILYLFTSVASHDLQEPLRKITLFCSKMRHELESTINEKGMDYLTRVERSANRMKELIVGILSFSVSTGRNRLPTPVSLVDVLSEALSDLDVSISETNACIEVENLPSVFGDPVQLSLLFRNLLSNSIKFAKEGVVPRIFIDSQSCPDGMAQINIRDNGIGFDPVCSEYMFDPLQRLNAKERYEGVGMGLTICRRIAEQNGGTISAEGFPGCGATFRVRLPLAYCDEPYGQTHDSVETVGACGE